MTELRPNVIAMNDLSHSITCVVKNMNGRLTLQEIVGCLEVYKQELINRDSQYSKEYK